jgi:hypothetical protein
MRLRKGQIVCVEFLDHCTGATEPLPFAVYGRLAHIDDKSLSVDVWCHRHKRHAYDDNVERFTIIRSAITKIVQLQEV